MSSIKDFKHNKDQHPFLGNSVDQKLNPTSQSTTSQSTAFIPSLISTIATGSLHNTL